MANAFLCQGHNTVCNRSRCRLYLSRLLLNLLILLPLHLSLLQLYLAKKPFLDAAFVEQIIQVSWLLEVRLVRVCSSRWEYQAKAAFALEFSFCLSQEDLLLLRNNVTVDSIKMRNHSRRAVTARDVHRCGQVGRYSPTSQLWMPIT